MRAALLSSVSHDLKTPLATIMGAGSTLLEYGDRISSEDRSELLHSVQDEARRLHSYVQNLLDMTRIGSPDFQLKRDWVDLADLVENARRRLDSSWRQHKLLVHFDQQIPASMCTVPDRAGAGQHPRQRLPLLAGKHPHRVQGDAGGPRSHPRHH